MTSIVLVGPRCVGKTEKGKLLAALRNIPFVDADEAFEKEHGKSIAKFVKENGDQGWQEFRKYECRGLYALTDAYSNQDIVLTPGGGAVAHDQGESYRVQNVGLLRGFGTVVYLLPFEDNLLHNSVELTCRIVTDPRSADLRPKLLKDKDIKKAEEDKREMSFLELFIRTYQGESNEPGVVCKAANDAYEALSLMHHYIPSLSLDGIFTITARNPLEDKFVKEFVDMHVTLGKRNPLYKAAAHHIVYTGDMTSVQAAHRINALVK